MALVLNGSGHLSRLSGLISSTSAFTFLLAVKRTATQTGVRYLWAMRPTDDLTDHGIYINDPAFTTEVVAGVNFGDDILHVGESLPLDTWCWVAFVGDGINVTYYVLDGTTWLSDLGPQTSFSPNKLYIGDGGAAVHRITAKFAAIREWDIALTQAQLGQEVVSSTPVIEIGLVSAKSGTGANLAAALLGETGTTFVASGTVTVDSDEPDFDTAIDLSVSQTLADFSQVAILSGASLDAEVNQALEDFTQTATIGSVKQFSFTVDLVPSSSFQFTVDLIGELSTEQTMDDFTQTVEVVALSEPGHFFVNQQMEDFEQSSQTVVQVSNTAPTRFTYTAISCGPGSYGAPVSSSHRLLKREIHRAWPTR